MNERPSNSNVHVVLVPGFWLGAWAWGRVEPVLLSEGLTTHPITPAGLSDGRSEATLADQVDAVVEFVEGLEGSIVLVGHSGGGAVVQGVVDRIPERIRRVVYVDTGPLADGTPMWHEPVDGDSVPFPTWEELEAFPPTALDGLDRRMLSEFRNRAVPQPGGVAGSVVKVADPRRLDVPATLVCTSIPTDEFRRYVEAGNLPSEVDALTDVRLVDLPTGHWPMFSRPEDLGRVIAYEARISSQSSVESVAVSLNGGVAEETDQATNCRSTILASPRTPADENRVDAPHISASPPVDATGV